jgi:hypothetical protein
VWKLLPVNKKISFFKTSRPYNVAVLKRNQFLQLIYAVFSQMIAILLISVLAHLLFLNRNFMEFGTQAKTGLVKFGDNCTFYSTHLTFQGGRGGNSENGQTLPLL